VTLPDYALPDDALLAKCEVRRTGAGGPGGQHQQKHATAVRLRHPSGVEAIGRARRDGARNRAEALVRLRLRLACVRRGAADPAWLAERRRGRRLPVTPAAKGYHLVIAVLLDALAVADGDLRAAAEACSVSTSQLAKALAADKEVRAAADALRAAAGLPPMRAP